MSDRSDIAPARRDKPATRDERLARALRQNLRRRKEQARARQPSEDAEPAGKPSA